jgi:hypothetical protein
MDDIAGSTAVACVPPCSSRTGLRASDLRHGRAEHPVNQEPETAAVAASTQAEAEDDIPF